MLVGIFVLLSVHTLDFAEPVLMPVVFALLVSLLLRSPVRMLRRAGIPNTVGASVVLGGSLIAVLLGAYVLAEPASEWLRKAPMEMRELEWKLRDLKRPIQAIHEAGERIEEVTAMAGGKASMRVELRDRRLMDVVLNATPGAIAAAATIFILMFYILTSGDELVRKLVVLAPSGQDKRNFIQTMREIESEVSRFLITITVINLCLGVLTALALFVYGVPNAGLWGALVALLNFAPYIGAAGSLVVLTLVGLTSFDDLQVALGVPAIFLVLTALEGQIITPIVLGRTLSLNPLGIFVALLFWGWLWGLPGALLAVPMLTVANIICRRIPRLAPAAALLARNGG
ncbi:MAG: AI-2E family transporter [Gammaproteobacteria bacterium]|nr:AI-2E family transporter [Gammaproteobacteria bacterium]